MMPSIADLSREAVFKTSRSGGSGGQNVNKVSTKVELVFSVVQSQLFNDEERFLLLEKLQNRLDSEGKLHMVAQEERSQLMNKQRALLKLKVLLNNALQVQKPRRPTKLPKAAKEKRLQIKAHHAERKASRRKLDC